MRGKLAPGLLVLFANACVATSGAGAGDGSNAYAVDENDEGSAAGSVVTGNVSPGSKLKTTSDLNLRRLASTSSSVIDTAPKGTVVTALASSPSNGFYKVQWGSQSGWMYGAYLVAVSSGGGGGGGGTSDTWSCTGSYGTTKPSSGIYDLTAFGCWIDASGVAHGDSGDNCIPGCFNQLKSAGLCKSSESGKACEQRITWFVADAGRFGCLTRVKITNPSNGRSVVAAVIDYGPACWVERKTSSAALDASGRVNRYLFGSDQGVEDRAKVKVEEVPASTPLGPA